MKVKVILEFRDKGNFLVCYNKDGVYEFDKARAESLIARGFVEPYEEPKVEAAKEEVAVPKAKRTSVKKIKND